MIRIGFDGRALASPAAGVRRYVHELFGAMAALREADVDIVAVGAPLDMPVPPGVTRAAGALSLPSNAGWMVSGLPRAARAARLDLFHAPSYTAPFGGPRPLVLTIHDVSYERHPEWYPYRRDPVRRAFYRWSARTADRIITDSEFSKEEIIAAYRLAPGRIDVVPLAAAPVFSPPAAQAAAAPAVPESRFILHVGDLHPRRNLEIAARAMLGLRARGADLASVRFVLAGVDRGAADALAAIGAEAQGMIEIRGRTTEEELLELYRTASVLVYPSLYEGFGLPLLEAMACGTPVVASRTASIPEVAGAAARLVDPHDEAGWMNAIEAALQPAEAGRLRAAGLARSREFTWRRTAEATLTAYRKALGVRA